MDHSKIIAVLREYAAQCAEDDHAKPSNNGVVPASHPKWWIEHSHMTDMVTVYRSVSSSTPGDMLQSGKLLEVPLDNFREVLLSWFYPSRAIHKLRGDVEGWWEQREMHERARAKGSAELKGMQEAYADCRKALRDMEDEVEYTVRINDTGAPDPGLFQFQAETANGHVIVGGKGELDDMVSSFRGFLIAMGYSSEAVTTAMGREW